MGKLGEGTFRERRVAKFRMSFEMLKELLDLPEGAEVVCVAGEPIMHEFNKAFEVYVQHEDLKEVVEHEQIPEISPTWRGPSATRTAFSEGRFRRIIFEDWGQSEIELPRHTPEPENPDLPRPNWQAPWDRDPALATQSMIRKLKNLFRRNKE